MKKSPLSTLPQIETILQEPEIQYYSGSLGRPIVTEITRSSVEKIRHSVLNEQTAVPPFPEIVCRVAAACRHAEIEKLQKVVNATGIIIHTNMGRAPLMREVWREAEEINCGYSNLELDLQTGKRGKRKGLIPLLVSTLVGAEDALIVNNNAAAVFLMLTAFAGAETREVIVNRGEQVQIGGGFRIPEILDLSGARLVEIGTTNISTVKDYLDAFSENTAMVLSVHRSNFALRGFTAAPSIRELAKIKPEGVLLCVDQGSGVLEEPLPGETSVRSYVHDGADLVSFSADKVMGGPQAGIIVGRKDLIARMEHHPLMRVFRPGKTVYSLLESMLIRRLNGSANTVSSTLSISSKELKSRGKKILSGIDREKASIVESTITTGGGSSPDESFPSLSVRIHIDQQPEKVLRALREAIPPIIGTISNDRVQLNLATIQNEEVPHVRTQLKKVLGA
jgi:L-seryl-tRNA(Ser) seleniumtransferase